MKVFVYPTKKIDEIQGNLIIHKHLNQPKLILYCAINQTCKTITSLLLLIQ